MSNTVIPVWIAFNACDGDCLTDGAEVIVTDGHRLYAEVGSRIVTSAARTADGGTIWFHCPALNGADDPCSGTVSVAFPVDGFWTTTAKYRALLDDPAAVLIERED